MAYSENLAARVRKLLDPLKEFEEMKMFGGICFLFNGNMACGILNNELIVRVGPKLYEEMLARPHARKFDITGRPMKGWVMIAAEGLASDKELHSWVHRGKEFAGSLPPKKQ